MKTLMLLAITFLLLSFGWAIYKEQTKNKQKTEVI